METCSHLLETRRVMDKCLVCDIQVRDITLSATGLQIKTNKWLHLEDWLEIDAAIERILEPFVHSETLDGFESNNFHLGGAIRIDCRKTKVSRSHKRILGEEQKYLPIALEIQVTKINTKTLMEQITMFEKKLNKLNTQSRKVSPTIEEEKNLVQKESQREYDPTAHITVTDKNTSEYVPYTASSKTPSALDTSGSAISEPYSPKPIAVDTSSPDQISESPNQVPNYKPARIASTKQKPEPEVIENNNERTRSSRRRHSPEVKLKTLKVKEDSRNEKTKRVASHNTKPTRNAELFGSDDSDQEPKTTAKAASASSRPQQISKDSTSLNPTSSSSHEEETTRKRMKLKHDSSSSRKNVLDNWLSKGSIKSSDKPSGEKTNGKSSSSKKSSRHESSKPKTSKDDQERQELEAKHIKELAALRDALKASRKSPPPEIEILSLTHLSFEDILKTFKEMRPILDPIFKIYSKKTKVTGFEGINHMKTLMLIDDKKQLQMLNFLRENYQPNEKGVPSLTDLYINAMVPEWTVNVFMKEYKFTRSEALQRLEAQEECTVRNNSEDLLDISDPI
ncbi:uncharacterized protein LOC129953303 [Eupeodes corollae]|uniref:uncharacterized protein LOC129953303 n=1 Tax=Eupeodes corollae TaxID=290404 RepID=UPI00248FE19C|nr:uncharacterized protein LOC129953303 [Eupeodes corollae]